MNISCVFLWEFGSASAEIKQTGVKYAWKFEKGTNLKNLDFMSRLCIKLYRSQSFSKWTLLKLIYKKKTNIPKQIDSILASTSQWNDKKKQEVKLFEGIEIVDMVGTCEVL